MNTYKTSVIKTGNSVALRIPKQYVLDANLVPGEKVLLNLPSKQKQQDHIKIKQLIGMLQKLPAYPTISNPTSWQRGIRQDRPLPDRK